MRAMAANGLNECWRGAAAAKPSDWRLMGVVCGPRETDPNIRGADDWCTWPRAPKGERAEGRGPSPEDASQTLTVHLQELSA